MSEKQGSNEHYEIREVDDRYDKVILDNEQQAEAVIELYEDSRGNFEYLRHALGGSFFVTNDFTPIRIDDRPNEIFVTKEKTDVLKRTADEVLEE